MASIMEQQPAASLTVPPPAPALNLEQDTRANVAQPDFNFTPGNLCTPTDPNFKEYRYPEHIAYCNRNVSKEMKLQVAAHYNVPQSDWTKYEFDHLVPLGIGGDSSIDNLWPQPRGGADSDGKDKLENDLFNQLSAGKITQKAAVQKIYDWFKKYMSLHPEFRNTPLAAVVS
ncbi:MAG: hypothetical protein NTY45_11305 [Elusimicrobia bacterium]|nr:hypothetical protein [Elusimicrobiota bacterium]